ncbi:hypothetical protein PV797_00035 [Clostridiaceae bacterium M8S5]|nr:hypothetical protein PV797_00035 [Clostridiaceae bacterium M8S5]
MIHMMLTIEGSSLSKEMLEYFSYSAETATVSAFNQQLGKLLPDALNSSFMKVDLIV